MTLDEAIKHCEEVAEKKEKECKRISGSKDEEMNGALAKTFADYAEERRQLADWLKELKAYREREPSYEAGYNDAKREIALSGEYKRAYDRGYEQACKGKIDIPRKKENDADSD